MGKREAVLAAAMICALSAEARQPAETETRQRTEVVEVVGTTPLGGGADADKIPSNVQSAAAAELRHQHALDLAGFMKSSLSSAFVNEAQANPLQPDVQYRGFVGSPLLGLPQGLAVYQDGVRINEPFGDTVNWALIPESAIDTVYLMPGSNPLFGLNALGGAISISTKDGFSNPETRAEVSAGSFSRLRVEAETGGTVGDRFGYFVTGARLDEDGWRDFSPTDADQLFADLTWRLDRTRIDTSITLVDTDLIGNGAAPVDLLERDRKAIFTRPDRTRNDLALFNVVTRHDFSSRLSLTGNVYVRNSDVKTYNGDDSDYEPCDEDPGFICIGGEDEDGDEDGDGDGADEEGGAADADEAVGADADDANEADGAGEAELVRDRNGNPVPAGENVEGATVNRTSTRQNGRGFGLQASWSADLGGRENLLVVGFAYDESDIGFDASTELGRLDATRLAIPSGVLVGDSFTRMNGDTANAGLYVSDTLSLSERVALTLSGRFNRTEVELHDELGTALDGDHEFEHFNPALGLTARLTDRVTFYAGYSESNRTPSPVELTCADENDPCRLPNAFLADPPLEQVVAETFEAGIRGRWEGGDWHAGAFRTTNKDDILFISAGALTNQGFFGNVGRTRREGIELDVNGRGAGGLTWFANYTYLEATFREHLAVPSPNNPAAVGGEVIVEPGDRLPLIPSRLLKAGVRVPLGKKLTLGADFLASSSVRFRGDEGNDAEPVDGYSVLNARADYAVGDKLHVFLVVDNVLDREYETFGLFGEADEVLGEDFDDPRFLSPSAPRAAWVGVSVDF